MRAKFGVVEQTQGLHLQAKLHVHVFIVSTSGGQKPQFWENLTFWGSCTDLLLPMRAKFSVLCQTLGLRLRAKFRLDRFILSSVTAKKKTIFAVFAFFWTSAFSDVDNWHQSQKVEHGAQPQTSPYPTASNSFLYSSAFMAKSGAQSLTFKSVTDRQTNRQTDKQTKNSTGRVPLPPVYTSRAHGC